ncbi:MAG: ZIP family metal transporter [Elusimicrobiota bacterium]
MTVIFYSLLAGLSTISGTLLLIYRKSIATKYSSFFVSFSAGFLLSLSLLHLLPEAAEIYPYSFHIALAGFTLFYIIENIIMIHPCHDDKCEMHRVGLLSFIGLLFHSFIDGVAIVIGFEVSPQIGILTLLGVILHEMPEGVIVTGILLNTGTFSLKKVWIYSVSVALATPVGALIALLILGNLSDKITAALLAFTAGTFLYLSASSLIPQTHRMKNKTNALLLISGIILVVILEKILH